MHICTRCGERKVLEIKLVSAISHLIAAIIFLLVGIAAMAAPLAGILFIVLSLIMTHHASKRFKISLECSECKGGMIKICSPMGQKLERDLYGQRSISPVKYKQKKPVIEQKPKYKIEKSKLINKTPSATQLRTGQLDDIEKEDLEAFRNATE